MWATTAGNPDREQLDDPWLVITNGVPTFPAAAWVNPDRKVRTLDEHAGTEGVDPSALGTHAARPKSTMACAVKSRLIRITLILTTPSRHERTPLLLGKGR